MKYKGLSLTIIDDRFYSISSTQNLSTKRFRQKVKTKKVNKSCILKGENRQKTSTKPTKTTCNIYKVDIRTVGVYFFKHTSIWRKEIVSTRESVQWSSGRHQISTEVQHGTSGKCCKSCVKRQTKIASKLSHQKYNLSTCCCVRNHNKRVKRGLTPKYQHHLPDSRTCNNDNQNKLPPELKCFEAIFYTQIMLSAMIVNDFVFIAT